MAFILRVILIDSKAQSNLARPVMIQIPTQSLGRYTAELPLRRIKLFSFQENSPYVPSTHTLWIFWGLAGWKLRLRPLRFFYVQLYVSQNWSENNMGRHVALAKIGHAQW